MNWQDIGGRTKVQHVVVEWNYGIRVQILCKHHIIQLHRVWTDNRQLPHCQQCITALKKLIEESNKTVQLEAELDTKAFTDAKKRETQKSYPKQNVSGDPFFAEGIGKKE